MSTAIFRHMRANDRGDAPNIWYLRAISAFISSILSRLTSGNDGRELTTQRNSHKSRWMPNRSGSRSC